MTRKKKKPRKKKRNSKTRYYFYFGCSFLLFLFYYICLRPNVNINSDYFYFYVPANATSASVIDSLQSQNLLKNEVDFFLMTKILKFEKPNQGLYQIHKSWGNLWLLNKLREENNKLWINYEIRPYNSRRNTVKSVCNQFNLAPEEFNQLLEDEVFLKDNFNLNTESIYSIFLPAEYKTYKGKSSKEVLTDIYNEYRFFWNDDKIARAKKIKCTAEEVVTLASIVYAETKNMEEMPLIAGLYLNRLNKKMYLQADPTLVFAKNASNTRRVYFKDFDINSPYNTYKKKGLPPGPIGPAPIEAIESVLNASSHDYLYFCAKEDQSGCHYFSEDFEEHKKYAQKYRSMLNRKKIK